MAKNLFRLSHYYPLEHYREHALQMLKNIQHNFSANAQSHANWLQLALQMNHPFHEVAIVGLDFLEKARQMTPHYLPDTLFAGTLGESSLALLEHRYEHGLTPIYICEGGACRLPVQEVSVALVQLQESRYA
jgi:uncharacterized protein YyaL (SSP411 family)